MAEIDAVVLQAAVALGLALVALFLHRRYRRPYFAWFAAAFALYVLRLVVIVAFVISEDRFWLYWHQVATGWTALALLWASQLFSRARPFRAAYASVLLFPVIWSYVAIYILDSFLWAALPAVVFLAIVTAGAGAMFIAFWRRTRMPGAALLGTSLLLWAVHHLDYPFLRARGAWVPWGYYIDTVFLLLVGAGLLILVSDDLRGGLHAMMALAEPSRAVDPERDLSHLLHRAATLPAATGAAIYAADGSSLAYRAIGSCEGWTKDSPPPGIPELLAEVRTKGQPVVRTGSANDDSTGRATRGTYRAALVIPRDTGDPQILVVAGEGRQPFTALDDKVLVALGRQLGSVMDGAELNARLSARTVELSRLSARMIQQHEEERRRLSLELHDETAQVFSAVKLRLGVIGEGADADTARSITQVTHLVDQGMRSIRNVTEMLRPAALDDLGLEAALRSLALEFKETTGIEVDLVTQGTSNGLSNDADLVIFRALQEGLSNVVRHASARRVRASLSADSDVMRLTVVDDGTSAPTDLDIDKLQGTGHTGLAGIRERVESLGGQLLITRSSTGGMELHVELPAAVEGR